MLERSFHIITFGCQMNEHDSQWLAAALEKMGFVNSPLEQAQVVILNTCSVRHKPEAKVQSALGRVRQATGNNPEVCVAVCGCVAQQLGAKLFESSFQVRLVAGTDGITRVPAVLPALLQNSVQKMTLLDFDREYIERAPQNMRCVSSFVAIMQGCDNFCSYCIVPFTRGRQKSRFKKDILAECRLRAEEGSVELTLLGQNVNAWGKDNGQGGFASLLREIAEISGIERIRYVTPHPKDMTAEDIRAFAEIPSLCPRLHLPMQAGSDKVLAAMRRRYDSAFYLRLVDSLKEARPDLALSTDIIVGFPGEDEDDFARTVDLLRRCSFMSSFSFCYSDRPGARAALFPDKVDPAIQQNRLLRLQEAQETLSRAWLDSRIGASARVLVTGESPRPIGGQKTWQGRDEYGAIVHIPSAKNLAGHMVECKIAGATRHSLTAMELGSDR